MSLLASAATRDIADVVYVLLDGGADPGHTDWMGATPIVYARSAVVFQLLRYAQFPTSPPREVLAHLDRYDGPGWWSAYGGTPLARVITSRPPPLPPPPPPGAERDDLAAPNHADAGEPDALVATLLDLGADPNERVRSPAGETPVAMALASRSGRARLVPLLLQRGADPNLSWCPDASPRTDTAAAPCDPRRGLTPLMAAAATASTEAIAALLRHGARTDARDWLGRSAIDHAPVASKRGVARALRVPLPPDASVAW